MLHLEIQPDHVDMQVTSSINSNSVELLAEIDQAIAKLDRAEGGSSQPGNPALAVDAPKSAGNATGENPIPRIRSGLVLDIEVYVQGISEIHEQAKRVGHQGEVTLPIIGTTHADGLSLEELEDRLTKSYEQFMRQPQVIVSYSAQDSWVTASPWGYVTVMGRVKQPGRVPLPPTRDLTVSVAIQSVGGFDSSHKKSSIVVSRKQPDGSRKKIFVNLNDLGKKGDFDQDVLLFDHDVVYVPERIL